MVYYLVRVWEILSKIQCKKSSDDALYRSDNKGFTLRISLLEGSNTDKQTVLVHELLQCFLSSSMLNRLNLNLVSQNWLLEVVIKEDVPNLRQVIWYTLL